MKMTRIFVDTYGCPVIDIIERIAGKFGIPVTLICDDNHILTSAYSEIKVISPAAYAIDNAFLELCREGDIVVTPEHEVAAKVIEKGAYAIHQNGRIYTQKNIDKYLFEKHRIHRIYTYKRKRPAKVKQQYLPHENEKFARTFEILAYECTKPHAGPAEKE